MEIANLYKEGVTFEELVEQAGLNEKDETLQILDYINFGSEIMDKVGKISEKIKVLVCAELWCPDCRANVPVLEKMRRHNGNIEFSIIGKDAGEEFLKPYSPDGEVRIPTFVICSEDFTIKGLFIERPAKVNGFLKLEDENLRRTEFRKYKKGEYAEETAKEVLEIIL